MPLGWRRWRRSSDARLPPIPPRWSTLPRWGLAKRWRPGSSRRLRLRISISWRTGRPSGIRPGSISYWRSWALVLAGVRVRPPSGGGWPPWWPILAPRAEAPPREPGGRILPRRCRRKSSTAFWKPGCAVSWPRRPGVTGPPPLARGRRADAVVYDGQRVWVVEAKRYGGGGPAHQGGAAGPVPPSSSGGPGAAPAVRSRRRRARAGR